MHIYQHTFFQDNRYYVYMYMRARKSKHGDVGTPYYIGKGCRYRAYEKHHAGISVPKNTKFIQIISENMREMEAFNLEKLLICLYGRMDKQTGCLRNKTDGGDGTVGLCVSLETRKLQSIAKIGGTVSVQTKKKMSSSHTGNKNHFFGKHHSIESRKLISKNNGKGQAKVTESQVIEIRRLYTETKLTQKEIGKLFGLSTSATNQIITRRWWKDVI